MNRFKDRYSGTGCRWPAAAVLLFALSPGCSINADNPAGYDYTGRGPNTIIADTLVVTGADTTWALDLSLEESPRLFVGEFGGYRAATLFRFGQFPEVAQVENARLILNSIEADASEDSTESITLNLYRVASEWDSAWGGDELADLNAVLGELISQAVVPLSATADTFGFSLPDTLVQRWIDDPGEAVLGVALVAEAGAPFLMYLDSADASYSRAGLRPKLNFDYIHPEAGDVRAESLEPQMDLSMVSFSEIPDNPAEDGLWVGRGAPFRALVTFDVSGIPAGITVNRADLILGVRTDEGITENVSIVAALPLSAEPWYLPVNETMTGGTTSAEVYVDPSDSTARLVVTRALAAHFFEPSPQLGLMVVAVGEGSGVGLIKLWDSTSQPADLARLEIIYSLPSGVTP